MPKIILIAGPNGAGKTTFAREFLPHEAGCPAFVNADLIAEGLSPFAPQAAALRAGRLMLEAIAQHVARRESFAVETTLSGLSYERHIKAWRAAGYQVVLFFLALPCADMAVQRVAERVRQGGHGIPEAVVRRRFDAGRRLFTRVYQPLVDAWVLYDSAGEEPILLDWSPKAMDQVTPPSPGVQEPAAAYAPPLPRPTVDLQGAGQAMRRAALRARALARQTGTALILVRDGQVVRVSPADTRR